MTMLFEEELISFEQQIQETEEEFEELNEDEMNRD